MEQHTLILLISVLLFCPYVYARSCSSYYPCTGFNEKCCSGVCKYGTSCDSCSWNSDCSFGKSCCASECKSGYASCIGYFCNYESDCQSDETCCGGRCQSSCGISAGILIVIIIFALVVPGVPVVCVIVGVCCTVGPCKRRSPAVRPQAGNQVTVVNASMATSIPQQPAYVLPYVAQPAPPPPPYSSTQVTAVRIQ